MPRATKTKVVAGRVVSAKSKTGSPACSRAASAWAKSRHGGPAAGPEVFSVLAKCRQQARQNKQAELKQNSGKLAKAGGKTSVDTGRGTWQRSEKAAQLTAERKARVQARVASMKGANPDRATAARSARYERLEARKPEIKAMLADARTGRAAEIRGERKAKQAATREAGNRLGNSLSDAQRERISGQRDIGLFRKGAGFEKAVNAVPEVKQAVKSQIREAKAREVQRESNKSMLADVRKGRLAAKAGATSPPPMTPITPKAPAVRSQTPVRPASEQAKVKAAGEAVAKAGGSIREQAAAARAAKGDYKSRFQSLHRRNNYIFDAHYRARGDSHKRTMHASRRESKLNRTLDRLFPD